MLSILLILLVTFVGCGLCGSRVAGLWAQGFKVIGLRAGAQRSVVAFSAALVALRGYLGAAVKANYQSRTAMHSRMSLAGVPESTPGCPAGCRVQGAGSHAVFLV